MENIKYKIIYCDPPWSFNSKKTGGNMTSGALAKYPTMTLAELKTWTLLVYALMIVF